LILVDHASVLVDPGLIVMVLVVTLICSTMVASTVSARFAVIRRSSTCLVCHAESSEKISERQSTAIAQRKAAVAAEGRMVISPG
jgi:nitrate/TMAO reductase-like tetraheme cytochrome c subunit